MLLGNAQPRRSCLRTPPETEPNPFPEARCAIPARRRVHRQPIRGQSACGGPERRGVVERADAGKAEAVKTGTVTATYLGGRCIPVMSGVIEQA